MPPSLSPLQETDIHDQSGEEETQLESLVGEDLFDEEPEEEETQDAYDEDDLPVEDADEQEDIPMDEENAATSTTKMVETEATKATKRNRVKEPTTDFGRVPRKSLLPVSRVQKIIRADKDIPIIAKDAVFLISLATEEFIGRMIVAGQRVANREHRSTVQHRDLSSVVRRIDEFLFLEEIMPWMTPATTSRQTNKSKESKTAPLNAEPTFLDQFVKPSKGEAEGQQDGDVHMVSDSESD